MLRHRAGVFALTALTLGACARTDGPTTADRRGATAAVSFSISTAGSRSARAADWADADRVWVHVARVDETVLDTVLTFDPAATEQRYELEISTRYRQDRLSVLLEIRAGLHALGRSVGSVELGTGATSNVSLAVTPTESSLAVGATFSCGISVAGLVNCWGGNQTGQLGSGSLPWVGVTSPQPVASGLTFRSIAAGGTHACAIATDGATYCWGLNRSGELGTGTSVGEWPFGDPSIRPVAGGLKFTAVTVGGQWESTHSCGLTALGKAYCWGVNDRGQLGTGNTAGSLVPVAVAGNQTFVAISAGLAFTCAIDTERAAYCWGSKDFGQLGNASATDALTPVRVQGDVQFIDISAGADNNVCGLAADGRAFCWGNNNVGQLGGGTWGGTSNVPVVVATQERFVQVSAGAAFACAVTADGRAFCWGHNAVGRIGIGAGRHINAPEPVAGGLRFVSVAAGVVHGCGKLASGGVACWGDAIHGKLGNGKFGYSPTPLAASLVPPARAIAVGVDHACVLDTSGAPFCWGANDYSQVGSLGSFLETRPLRAGGSAGPTFASMVAGPWHNCGLTAAGVASCWGRNDFGQLGSGGTSHLATPTALNGRVFSQLSAGWWHTCGLDAGRAYCWGRNAHGQLGTGSTTSSSVPVAVAGNLTFSSIAAGPAHTCAITTTGAAYCWGSNYRGQLGTGNRTDSRVPAPVLGGLTFSALAGGGQDYGTDGTQTAITCGITTAGDGYCWGQEEGCFIGIGTCAPDVWHPSPERIASTEKFSSIAISIGTACMVTTTGTPLCWGANDIGQLGIPRLNDPFGVYRTDPGAGIPVPIPGLTVSAMAAGGGHACAIVAQGAVRCWGALAHGLAGDGTLGFEFAPVPVLGGLVIR